MSIESRVGKLEKAANGGDRPLLVAFEQDDGTLLVDGATMTRAEFDGMLGGDDVVIVVKYDGVSERTTDEVT